MHFWEQADSVSTLFCFLIVCRTGIVPFFAHSVGKRSSSENVTSQELTFQCRCRYVAGCRCTIFWCRPPVLCWRVSNLHQVALALLRLLVVLNKSNVTRIRCIVPKSAGVHPTAHKHKNFQTRVSGFKREPRPFLAEGPKWPNWTKVDLILEPK